MEPAPDHPGWLDWRVADEGLYNHAVIGRTLVRRDDEAHCRVRIMPRRALTNLAGGIHGGAILGLIDISLFVALKVLRDVDAGRTSTLTLDTQFVGPGNSQAPLDSVVEVLRETGRLCFLRGLVEQDGALVASFHATVRKPSRA